MIMIKEYRSLGESLYIETLDNGLKILVSVKPGFNSKTAFFAVNYGSVMQNFTLGEKLIKSPAGVAHFLEHKLFDNPDGSVDGAFALNGASPNAFTSYDMTAYHFDCTDNFDANLSTLLSFVMTPYFTEESVAKERGIIEQEIRMWEGRMSSVNLSNLYSCMYENHPVATPILGTKQSISEITADTLYTCHSAFYNPSNMALTVAGDVDPQAVFDAAGALTPAGFAEKALPDYGHPEVLAPIKSRVTKDADVSAPQLVFGCKVMPKEGSALLRASLVSEIALGAVFGKSSPFYTTLYKSGMIRAGFSSYIDYLPGTGMFLAGCESPEPDRVLESFAQTLQNIRENGIDKRDLLRVKAATYGYKLRSLESFDSICYDLADAAFCGYEPLSEFALFDSIDSDECSRFICDNILSDNLAVSVLMPKSN